MTTVAQVAEAEMYARRQRIALAELLEVDGSLVGPSERKLVDRLLETTKGDGCDYDKAMAHPTINALFLRGAIKFRRPG